MQTRKKSAPCAGDVVELVQVRSEWQQMDEGQPEVRRGKLDYLGGPAAQKPVQRKKRRLDIQSRTQGRYIGNGEQIIAFVSLEDKTSES
jgi:hypothetical protein